MDNYREVTVKIFHDLDKYLKRCEQLKDLPTQPETDRRNLSDIKKRISVKYF